MYLKGSTTEFLRDFRSAMFIINEAIYIDYKSEFWMEVLSLQCGNSESVCDRRSLRT